MAADWQIRLTDGCARLWPRSLSSSGQCVPNAWRLGAAHGVLALIDLVRARAFTPTDRSVREAMQRAGLALPKANNWKAWMGSNLSHRMGAVLFGGLVATIGFRYFSLFSDSMVIQVSSSSCQPSISCSHCVSSSGDQLLA